MTDYIKIETDITNIADVPQSINAYRITYRKHKLQLIILVATTPLYNDKSVYTRMLHDIDIITSVDTIPVLCPHPIDRYTIAYGQLPISKLIEMYKPLIIRLSQQAYDTMSQYFDFEDLQQTAYLVLTQLVHKGYYIHKQLISSTYFNYLRTQLRHFPTHCEILSFDTPTVDMSSDDAIVTIGDTIEDDSASIAIDDVIRNSILDDRKQLVIAIIGQRLWDDWVRKYRSHTVDTGCAIKIKRLREKLIKENKLNDDK